MAEEKRDDCGRANDIKFVNVDITYYGISNVYSVGLYHVTSSKKHYISFLVSFWFII